jgi:hypothetical protein
MISFWDIYWHVAKSNGKDRQFAIGRVTRYDLERAVLGTKNLYVSFGTAAMMAKKVDTLRASWDGGMDNVYRVFINPNTKSVEVVCLGMDSVDSEAEGIYDDTSNLPMWMQERLAVLSMMKVDPPQTKVEGVGMRVDEHVYWIIKG